MQQMGGPALPPFSLLFLSLAEGSVFSYSRTVHRFLRPPRQLFSPGANVLGGSLLGGWFNFGVAAPPSISGRWEQVQREDLHHPLWLVM